MQEVSGGNSTSTQQVKRPIPKARWECFGIPDTIVVDNGLDLQSKAVASACLALGVEIVFTPPREPWYKGVVERMGRTLNIRLIHWLPGTTFGKPMGNYEYDAQQHASMSFQRFVPLLEHFLANIQNRHPHKGIGTVPVMRWRSGIEQWPVRLPENMGAFDAAFALTYTRVLQRQGIEFEYGFYNNEQLGVLWNTVASSTSVTIKVDPTDIRAIHVVDPTTQIPFKVECTTHYEGARHLSYHRMVVDRARRSGLDPVQARELAEAEAVLKDEIDDATKTSKKALRRSHAAIASGMWSTGSTVENAAGTDPMPASARGDGLDALLSDSQL